MKPIIIALTVLCACTSAVYSQNVQQSNRIIVHGTGNVEQPTDIAHINFTIIGHGESIEVAVAEAQRKAEEITLKLFNIGLKEESINTSRFNSGANYRGKAFLSSRRDYRAQIDSRVTIDSLAVLEDVVGLLAGSETDRLSNISFSLKDDASAQLEANRLAVANAREKALVIANELGMTVGRALHIEELLSQDQGNFHPPEFSYFEVSGLNDVVVNRARQSPSFLQQLSFFGQQHSVTSKVSVVFELIDPE